MCLKEFYVITFSNKEAFDRALQMLENPRFDGRKISGIFYKILEWKAKKGWFQPRNQLTFEMLFNLRDIPWLFEIEEITFDSHRKLADAIGEVADHDDIFGKIKVEIR